MYNFTFTKFGEKEFFKLDSKSKDRVLNKLKFLKSNLEKSNNFKKLNDILPTTHRIRVGNIRIILKKVDEVNFHILDIGYRGDIYN